MSQVLEAKTGRQKGSRPSGRLRVEGSIPGVLYGMGMEPIVLSVPWPELRRALNAEGGLSAPIRLRVAGKEHLTLVKELQRHPVRRDVLHVDFLAVDPDEEVTVEVQLVLAGMDDLGSSVVDKVVLLVHHLQITAKPGSIPTELPVDVSHITEGQELWISDLKLPVGVTVHGDARTVVAVCGTPLGHAGAHVEGAGEADAEEGSSES